MSAASCSNASTVSTSAIGKTTIVTRVSYHCALYGINRNRVLLLSLGSLSTHKSFRFWMRLDSPGVFWCTNMWRTTYLKPYRQGNDTLVKFKSRIQHLGSILKQERQINHPKGLVDRKPTTSFRMKATSSEGHKVGGYR